MRKSLLLFSLVCLTFPAYGQDQADDQGGPPVAPRALPAPEAQQDAEAAREKLLKAADQIDLIESNAESGKVAMDSMKADVAQLQASNSQLKQQLASLQQALDHAEAARAQDKQALIDEVSHLLATRAGSGKSAHPHPDPLTTATDDPPPPASSSEVHHAPVTEVAATTTSSSTEAAPKADPPAKPRKGYYHKVENGETLTMICAAYRDQGVKVSIAQVRKANGLNAKSVLKVGQKIFIPQPGA